MSEDQKIMIDLKIMEMEYIIYKYEQLKKIAEGFKTSIEAIVGGDVIFRDKEGENIYYLETGNASYIFIEPNVIIKEYVEEIGDFRIVRTEVEVFHQEEALFNFCRSEKIPVPPLKEKIK